MFVNLLQMIQPSLEGESAASSSNGGAAAEAPEVSFSDLLAALESFFTTEQAAEGHSEAAASGEGDVANAVGDLVSENNETVEPGIVTMPSGIELLLAAAALAAGEGNTSAEASVSRETASEAGTTRRTANQDGDEAGSVVAAKGSASKAEAAPLNEAKQAGEAQLKAGAETAAKQTRVTTVAVDPEPDASATKAEQIGAETAAKQARVASVSGDSDPDARVTKAGQQSEKAEQGGSESLRRAAAAAALSRSFRQTRANLTALDTVASAAEEAVKAAGADTEQASTEAAAGPAKNGSSRSLSFSDGRAMTVEASVDTVRASDVERLAPNANATKAERALGMETPRIAPSNASAPVATAASAEDAAEVAGAAGTKAPAPRTGGANATETAVTQKAAGEEVLTMAKSAASTAAEASSEAGSKDAQPKDGTASSEANRAPAVKASRAAAADVVKNLTAGTNADDGSEATAETTAKSVGAAKGVTAEAGKAETVKTVEAKMAAAKASTATGNASNVADDVDGQAQLGKSKAGEVRAVASATDPTKAAEPTSGETKATAAKANQAGAGEAKVVETKANSGEPGKARVADSAEVRVADTTRPDRDVVRSTSPSIDRGVDAAGKMSERSAGRFVSSGSAKSVESSGAPEASVKPADVKASDHAATQTVRVAENGADAKVERSVASSSSPKPVTAEEESAVKAEAKQQSAKHEAATPKTELVKARDGLSQADRPATEAVKVATASVSTLQPKSGKSEGRTVLPQREALPIESQPRVENAPVTPVARTDGAVVKAADSTTPAASASGPDSSAPRASMETLGDETVRQVKSLLSEGGQRVRVRLVPESLGELHVEVRNHKGEVTVRLVSASPLVREALEGQASGLRESLARDGVNLSRVDVSANMASDSGSSNGTMGRESSQQAFASRGRGPAFQAPRTQGGTVSGAPTRSAGYTSATGLNLLV